MASRSASRQVREVRPRVVRRCSTSRRPAVDVALDRPAAARRSCPSRSDSSADIERRGARDRDRAASGPADRAGRRCANSAREWRRAGRRRPAAPLPSRTASRAPAARPTPSTRRPIVAASCAPDSRRARDQVVHVGLVREDQQRHRVAVRRQVRRGVEARAQIGRPCRWSSSGCPREIAARRCPSRPSAPASSRCPGAAPGSVPVTYHPPHRFADRRLIGRHARRADDRIAVPVGDRRSHDEAGHAAGRRADSWHCRQVRVCRVDDRLRSRLLVDGVEHGASAGSTAASSMIGPSCTHPT